MSDETRPRFSTCHVRHWGIEEVAAYRFRGPDFSEACWAIAKTQTVLAKATQRGDAKPSATGTQLSPSFSE